MFVFIIVFLQLTTRASREKGSEAGDCVWKSFALPFLYHGLEGKEDDSPDVAWDGSNSRGEYSTLDQMEEAARSVRVQLSMSNSRRRLMLQ